MTAAGSYLDTLVRRSRVPGIQYLVVGPDDTVFEYAGGWADIAGCRPMTPATTMMAYSMSKTITAVAVLQLAEAGKLNLDDPISFHLPSLPYGRGLTARALLSHTAGVPNPIPLRWVHPGTGHTTFDERAALAEVVRAHPTATFKPGARYAYSNIGYWLLGSAVERASGQKFQSYVVDHVFQPLGITPLELGYDATAGPEHAHGYLEKYSLLNLVKRFLIDRALIGNYEGRWLRIEDHYPNGPAFGGLVGTAIGFGKFLQDQLRTHSTLFSDATRRLLYTPARTSDGAEIAMTLGWHIGSLKNAAFFFKEGGGGGFHSMMRVYPGPGIATVVMTNATGFDVRKLLDALDPEFMPSTGT